MRDDSDLINKAEHAKLSFADEQNMIKFVYFKMVETELYTSYMSEKYVDLNQTKSLSSSFLVKN